MRLANLEHDAEVDALVTVGAVSEQRVDANLALKPPQRLMVKLYALD